LGTRNPPKITQPEKIGGEGVGVAEKRIKGGGLPPRSAKNQSGFTRKFRSKIHLKSTKIPPKNTQNFTPVGGYRCSVGGLSVEKP
jgi:hypothetical protein